MPSSRGSSRPKDGGGGGVDSFLGIWNLLICGVRPRGQVAKFAPKKQIKFPWGGKNPLEVVAASLLRRALSVRVYVFY